MSHPSLPFGPFQFTGAMLGERFSPSSDPTPIGQPFAYAPGDAPRAVRSARPLNRPHTVSHVAGASTQQSAPAPFPPPRLTWPIVAPVETSQLPKQQVAGAWTDWLPPTSGISIFKRLDESTPSWSPSAPSESSSVSEGAESAGSSEGRQGPAGVSWLWWLAGGTAVAVVAGVAYSRMKK